LAEGTAAASFQSMLERVKRMATLGACLMLAACGGSGGDDAQSGGIAFSAGSPNAPGSGDDDSPEGAKTSEWVGLYANQSTDRAWAIRISKESPFTFEIVAGHLGDGDETDRVDQGDLVAHGDDGQTDATGITSVTMQKDDCTLTLTKSDLGITVKQDGLCTSVGFPSNEDLSLDPQGSEFTAIDESQGCFDKKDLAVGASSNACESPL
jgi:hypothetical protein